MLMVTATDPSGGGDSILVTINVTDEDDPAVIIVVDRSVRCRIPGHSWRFSPLPIYLTWHLIPIQSMSC